jgi:hypothetical protein
MFAFAQSMPAQTFVDTTKLWSTLECSVGPFGADCMPVYYKLKGDTIIDTRHYTNLHMTSDTTLLTWFPSGAIRDTANKAFFHDFVTEHLLYDFTANAGDTIKPISFCSSVFLIVDSVDSILVHGEMKRRILFHWPSCITTEEWIEDIGSIHGLTSQLSLYGILAADRGSDLLCYWQNDTLKFSNSLYNNCYYRTTGIRDTEHSRAVIVHPNPAKGNIHCKIDQSKESLNRVVLKNLTGQTIYENSQVSLGNFQIHSIDLSRLSDGLYILEIMNENFTSSHKIIKAMHH